MTTFTATPRLSPPLSQGPLSRVAPIYAAVPHRYRQEDITSRPSHTPAMEILQSGVDHAVIALWLGHESPETTHIYLQANLALKENALAKTKPVNVKTGRYRPGDNLLHFLGAL